MRGSSNSNGEFLVKIHTTTPPTEDNEFGYKIALLDEEPETKYDGWIYIIKESE